MMINQALIAIGGQARRLRADGVDVTLSKSFMTAAGKPLLHWTLCSLHEAGVRRVVLAADRDLQQLMGETIIANLPVQFDEVEWLRDDGLGTHGLPYYAREKMRGDFLFECGHNIISSDHYLHLAARKHEGTVVFSAFDPHPANPRLPVRLDKGKIRLVDGHQGGTHALATPLAIDLRYANSLPKAGFSVVNVIRELVAEDRLTYVYSEMPPEFDIRQELEILMPLYERYIRRSILV